MVQFAWRLTGKKKLLEIFEIDPETRKALLLMSLGLHDEMTEEEVLKYINSNYPRDGSSVGLAAEHLGIPTRKR